MSDDIRQIKAGQRGKVLQFATGMDLTATGPLGAPVWISVRVKGMLDETPRTYTGTVSPTDPTAIEITTAEGMFDTLDTVAVDFRIGFPGGKQLATDENVVFEVVDL